MQGYTLTLKETREVADGTRLFIFDKPEGYIFQAGQYVALTLPKLVAPDPKGPVRSFSIASSPFESEMHFAMRRGMSGFKQTFWQMQPGDTITITKAVGFFTVPKGDLRPVVFLVGGIGITPVRSILKQAAHEGSTRDFTLLYSNRFLKDAAFCEEIKPLPLPHFRCITVLSQSDEVCQPINDERGYICVPMITKYIDDIPGKLYYLVGSLPFVEAMEKMLIDLGVPKEQRYKDPFTGLRGVDQK